MKIKSLIAVLLMAGTLAMGQKVKSKAEGEAVNAVLTPPLRTPGSPPPTICSANTRTPPLSPLPCR